MNKILLKQIISWLLVVIWLIIIFVFSNTPNKESNIDSINTLNKVVETTLNSTNNLGITDKHPTDNKIKEFVNNHNTLFRKIIHVIIYLILSILILNALRFNFKINIKFYLLSFFLCFVCEIIDEYHQALVGRTGQITDVLIDLIGSTLGIIIYYIINKCLKKNK